MKRVNNVNVISRSTVTAVILSAVAMTLLSVLLMANVSFAKELGDEFGGPGIGLADSTWDGSVCNRIYGYGDLNGIEGDEVVEHMGISSDGPTNYFDYSKVVPINNYLIDKGPKSANNDAYSLHFINDGGPGVKLQSNELGKTMLYNDGGPGFMVSGLSKIEDTGYVDNGPTYQVSTVNPSDFIKFMNMKPGDFKFVGGTKADKLGK